MTAKTVPFEHGITRLLPRIPGKDHDHQAKNDRYILIFIKQHRLHHEQTDFAQRQYGRTNVENSDHQALWCLPTNFSVPRLLIGLDIESLIVEQTESRLQALLFVLGSR